jgi:hypothetical protein
VITGPVLVVADIGGSLWSLAAFLVIFGVTVVPLIARTLRPAVALLSSSERSEQVPPHVATGHTAGTDPLTT